MITQRLAKVEESEKKKGIFLEPVLRLPLQNASHDPYVRDYSGSMMMQNNSKKNRSAFLLLWIYTAELS